MAYHLAVDIGNTRTKFGLFREKELLHSKVFENSELEKNHQVFQNFDLEGVIISSVNKEVEKLIWPESSAIKVLSLNYLTHLPFRLKYQTPETLGKDRIAAVAGASTIFPGQNILVIDAGTCITYDFLTKNNFYLGGGISPGIQMRLKAMNRFTNQLPLLEWEEGERPETIGNTTIASMLSGAVNGLIMEINGFIADYQRAYSELRIVLTGGDSKLFEKELKNGIFADPNLVLKGLNEILIYNCE